MTAPDRPKDFIRDIIDADLAAGRHQSVVTRFPPEPNGYLHIGHAKSICLNFGIAKDYAGVCHLRFDDTNPTTEDIEYVEGIQRDIRWLGFDWGDKLFFASDYYARLYDFAEELIRKGLAYVCDLNEQQISEYRGTITEPGKPSPFRERSVAENLDLFRRMRAGEFPDGSRVVRAKIDMASPNMKLRDPLLYRIKHAHHYRSGDAWCIYPLYDFAHPLSDAIEGITHSICTLEFENNRDIYDWLIDNVELPARPRQYEFARLNLTYTVMSKRKLLELVESGRVSGWDDPRMPTIAGLRRRGVTPEAMRSFATRVGVAKNNSTVELALFEHTLREDLNERSPRVLCVLDPLEVVIENYPEGQIEELEAAYWPHDVPKQGSRKLPFSRRLFIDQSDFAENPPKDFFRLVPGREVRLRHAYVIKCERVEKDASGKVTRLVCSYDPATRGGDSGGRKVRGTIHWVSAAGALDVEVRVYDRLFQTELPGAESGDPLSDLNPDSLVVLRGCKAEPSLAEAAPGDRFQFEREGFFFVDPSDSRPGTPIFNRTVALKDTWAKLVQKAEPKAEARKAEPKSAAKAAQREGLSTAARALVEAHQLSPEDARVLGEPGPLRSLFDSALPHHDNARAVASWIVNELPRSDEPLPFGGQEVAELVALIDAGTLSGALGKKVLGEMLAGGGSPRAIVEKQGLRQIADPAALVPIVEAVLARNADTVARYRAGNKNVLGALTGMILRETRGQANPKLVSQLLLEKLG
ncbi:MAG: glutamine--tRNA ligase/YqeY domain fusion protein [Polyangiaceae bacterium]|nr:glutamine--tRNA ligase/YqeY domain fusion protein [Polyangiaceae bacterium]